MKERSKRRNNIKLENKSGKLDHGKTVVRRSNLNNWPIQKASAGIRC